jgi:hypothetical protein
MEEIVGKRTIKINNKTYSIAVAREAYSPDKLKIWGRGNEWYQRSSETKQDLINRVKSDTK